MSPMPRPLSEYFLFTLSTKWPSYTTSQPPAAESSSTQNPLSSQYSFFSPPSPAHSQMLNDLQQRQNKQSHILFSSLKRAHITTHCDHPTCCHIRSLHPTVLNMTLHPKPLTVSASSHCRNKCKMSIPPKQITKSVISALITLAIMRMLYLQAAKPQWTPVL